MKSVFSFALLVLWLLPVGYSQNPYEVKSEISKKTEPSAPKAEDIFLKNFPYYHMSEWKAGMRFMSLPGYDERSEIQVKPYKSKADIFDPKPLAKDFAWKIFTVTGIEERERKCPRGTCKTAYVVFECDGKKYEYEYLGSLQDMKAANTFTDIDKFAYLDEVDKAKSLLLDSSLYVMTDHWMRDEADHERYQADCPKFVKVKILKIGVGTDDGPVKMVFKSENEPEAHMNVRFSGVNNGSGVFGIDFFKAFSFENPRNKYKWISDEDWAMVQKSKVQIGMSDEVCRLSWGDPGKVNKTITNQVVSEQWVYQESYLYFEGGKLVAIQKI